GCIRKRDFSREKIVKLLIGRDSNDIYERTQNIIGKEILKLNEVYTNRLCNITLSLHEGEIIGITGLIGSGKTQIAQVITGNATIQSGSIEVHGIKQKKYSVPIALKNKIAYIHEDRHAIGLFLNMSSQENISICSLHKMSRYGYIKDKMKNHLVDYYIKLLSIKVEDKTNRVEQLSGGNQQKIVMARCLASGPKILIADEPTNGLDINSKTEIYRLLDSIAKKGVGIILLSSHIQEIMQMSDRVVVMRKGSIIGDFDKSQMDGCNDIKL
ncbi:MAG: ATP-binding cassette domain-containing protein, partial [Christensenellaceae bacterium]